jgi:hypothetical protein
MLSDTRNGWSANPNGPELRDQRDRVSALSLGKLATRQRALRSGEARLVEHPDL